MQCLPMQLATKVVTEMGYTAEGYPMTLHGLAGFHRNAVKAFTEACPTCAAKRATKPAKRPAAHAIRVSKPFSLCQVSLLVCSSWETLQFLQCNGYFPLQCICHWQP